MFLVTTFTMRNFADMFDKQKGREFRVYQTLGKFRIVILRWQTKEGKLNNISYEHIPMK